MSHLEPPVGLTTAPAVYGNVEFRFSKPNFVSRHTHLEVHGHALGGYNTHNDVY